MTGKSRKIIEINRVFFQENMKKRKPWIGISAVFYIAEPLKDMCQLKLAGGSRASRGRFHLPYLISDYVGYGKKKEQSYDGKYSKNNSGDADSCIGGILCFALSVPFRVIAAKFSYRFWVDRIPSAKDYYKY